MATTQCPIFTIAEPQHYSDYGFDPQMDYYQKIFEEARKHSTTTSRSRDRDRESTYHFKLQKPISKDATSKKKKRTRWWWWKSAVQFWKWTTRNNKDEKPKPKPKSKPVGVVAGARSGPLYVTESYGGSRTPCRRRAWGGTFRSSPLVVAEMGRVEMPYLSLSDVAAPPSAASPVPGSPAMPIYFVT